MTRLLLSEHPTPCEKETRTGDCQLEQLGHHFHLDDAPAARPDNSPSHPLPSPDLSSAVIAVDGAFGTLSEIAHAVGDGIPVIGLETWDLSINGQMKDDIIRAKDPVDAVEKAIEIARDRNNWRCPPTS